MRRAHDSPQAGFSFSNCGISNPRREHAFIEQFAAEIHGEAAFTNDDRRDRRFAGRSIDAADVEAQQSQLFLKEASIGPELVHQFRLLFQHIKGGNACSGHGWWMGSGKKKWTRAMIEEIDQI